MLITASATLAAWQVLVMVAGDQQQALWAQAAVTKRQLLPVSEKRACVRLILGQSADTRDLVAPARFIVTREEMAENPVLENILMERQLSARQNFNNAGELIEYTKRIIEKIEAREKN